MTTPQRLRRRLPLTEAKLLRKLRTLVVAKTKDTLKQYRVLGPNKIECESSSGKHIFVELYQTPTKKWKLREYKEGVR